VATPLSRDQSAVGSCSFRRESHAQRWTPATVLAATVGIDRDDDGKVIGGVIVRRAGRRGGSPTAEVITHLHYLLDSLDDAWARHHHQCGCRWSRCSQGWAIAVPLGVWFNARADPSR